VSFGSLVCRSCTVPAGAGKSTASWNGHQVAHQIRRSGDRAVFELGDELRLKAGERLDLEVRS
jgi:hypothetical protein